MALVCSIRPALRDEGRVHSPVQCNAFYFRGPGGKTYVQLDTLGSPGRQEQGKVSQSLQLDEGGARELLALLRKAFPRLA